MCTATGGVPDSHNITLLHSNGDQQLFTSMGNELRSYIGNSVFGEFICIVESLYNTKQISLFLQEKGTMKQDNIIIGYRTSMWHNINFNLYCMNSTISAPFNHKQVYSNEGN